MAGITLDEERAVTKALRACGANLAEINCVRKHLPALKAGRNSKFLLGLALGGHSRIAAIACGTDGIDGSEDNAVDMVLPDAPAGAFAGGIDLRARLTENDAYGVFAELGGRVVTGPTRTNVNDLRAILVDTNFLAKDG